MSGVEIKPVKFVAKIIACLFLALFIVIPGTQTASAQIGEVPEFFQDFIKFYSSSNLKEMGRYVHPDRGLVQNGILLTADEFAKEFQAIGPTIGKVDYMRLIFIEGFYPGDNFYRAKTYVEYRTAGYTQQVPTVFVFEQIKDSWYLVQSEKVEFNEQFRPFEVLTVGYVMTDMRELPTNTGRVFQPTTAVNNNKATLLYFFTILDLYQEENTGFFMSLINEFGKDKDLYIFGVTDDKKQIVDDWMTAEGLKFVWLNDEKSLLHYDLGILSHPEILLIDKTGRLVMMAQWEYNPDKVNTPGYYPVSHDLIKRRIRETLSLPLPGA